MYSHCICCHEPFTKANVYTKGGWRETQISGMCEECFDEVLDEGDEVPYNDYEFQGS